MNTAEHSAASAGRRFARASLTTKVAAAIIAVNFLGLLATGFIASQMSVAQQKDAALRNWAKDTAAIAAQAAGGVKWGKVEAVQSAYQIYKDDPKLSLYAVSAFDKEGQRVDLWSREDGQAAGAGAAVAEMADLSGGETLIVESGDLVVVSTPLPNDKDGMPLGQVRTAWSTEEIRAAAGGFALKSIGFQIAILTVSVALLLFVMRRFVGRPLTAVNERILTLQAGDYDSPVPHTQNSDEVGVIARALSSFCEAAKAKQQAEIDMHRQRNELDGERQANAEATQAAMQRQHRVVTELGRALDRLAAGDLTVRVPDLDADFRKLGEDFNAAVSALSDSVITIDAAQRSVARSSEDLENATDELARRTEQQAASLEETAAALDEITATVQAASQKASEAGEMVGSARDSANRSGKVVREAIDAMSRIEESSNRIAQILKVIDEIAFQTNLLALNAGVEAARAGEAGKGFAVVAQEVRELAGRSANAAREIKELIEASDRQVKSGVALVNETGSTIGQIEQKVGEVAAAIEAISISAREQATGISQINGAVNQMDTMTQQNAAMVQESHVASQGLGAECARLAQIVQGFRVSGTATAAEPAAPAAPAATRVAARTAAPQAAKAEPAAATARRVLAAAGNTALAAEASWEEF